MKTKRLLFLLIAFILINSTESFCQIVSIDDVQIIPDQPLPWEIITIQVFGEFTHGGLQFDNSIYTPDNFNLQLDLFFTEGAGPSIFVPWSRNEEIGMLTSGDYDLLVHAYWRSSIETSYILHDSYSTEFIVVPEPNALLLFTLGAFITRYVRRTGKK